MTQLTTAEQVATELANSLREPPARLASFHQRYAELQQALAFTDTNKCHGKPYSQRWVDSCRNSIAECEQLKQQYPLQARAVDHLITGWQRNITHLEQGAMHHAET